MARQKSGSDVRQLVSGARFLGDFINKLVDEVEKRGGRLEQVHRLVTKEGKEALGKFADLIVGDKKATPDFKVWKTIKLGTGLVTADDFRQALKKIGHRIGDWANDILGQRAFTAADKETEVDLVVVSVAELGFPKGATIQDIYRRAQDLGLELCPPEVGPQLRLQYQDQPQGEWLFIGMESITGSGGSLSVFGVERDGDDLWLCGHCGFPGSFWDGSRRWVFLRRK